MGYDFELAGETSLVHPAHDPSPSTLSINGTSLRAVLEPGSGDGEYWLRVDGEREQIFLATSGDTHFIHYRGRTHRVEAINALERARRAAEPSGGDEVLCAPMPGTVVDVQVAEGDLVVAGALLLTIESMKLQTAITAAHDTRVAEVFVSAGATFDQGAPLVRLEAPEVEADDETDQQAHGDESK